MYNLGFLPRIIYVPNFFKYDNFCHKVRDYIYLLFFILDY